MVVFLPFHKAVTHTCPCAHTKHSLIYCVGVPIGVAAGVVQNPPFTLSEHSLLCVNRHHPMKSHSTSNYDL